MSSEELGYLFLASGEDLKNREYGFSSDKTRQGYGTPYALANGLFRYSNGSSPYWTRSQSATKAYGTPLHQGGRKAGLYSLRGDERRGASRHSAVPDGPGAYRQRHA